MIKKINEISNLGSFVNFIWDSQKITDFNKYNFFYGWNYSGKTTLSRLFRCFELKQTHQDYPEMKFKIEEDGKIKREFSEFKSDVRVYNEDFIEENFKWNNESHKITPVLILGKENIELKEEIDKLNKEKTEKENKKESLGERVKKLEKNLDKELQSYATNVRKILKITTDTEFNKTKLSGMIDEIKDIYKSKVLNNDEEESKLSLYLDQREYKRIENVSFDNANVISTLINDTNSVLSRKITAQQIIQRLRDNPDLNEWVRKGIELHKGEDKCQFCGNALPNDLFDRLNEHFSDEYDRLMDNIDNIEDEINRYKYELEKLNPPYKEKFHVGYQDNYEKVGAKFNKLKEKLIEKLNTLREALEEKRKKPFDVLETVKDEELDKEFNKCLDEINKIIDQYNKQIDDLSKEKEKIKSELLEHYTAKAIEEITIDFNDEELSYFKAKEKIDELKEEISKLEQTIENIDNRISGINNEITKNNIGAGKINECLNMFFADDQIQLKLLDDGTYQIYRRNEIAKNLSLGERNIISLIYFIIKLEEDNFNKENAVIFIDDPVSSLDTNHLFRIYGFLSEKIRGCKQVFITTHNFDFFNLLKDLGNGSETNYYLVKRVMSDNQKVTLFENLPKVLRKFKSEYNYLFSVLYDFKYKDDKSNFELLYLMPNIIRRFLETFLYLKYPNQETFNQKCKGFIGEENLYRSVLKLINEYSHEQNPEHATKFPDIQEVVFCVNTILEILESKDKEHYCALKSSIKNTGDK